MIYLHLPFCRKKCPYCHFFVLPDSEPEKELLLQGLLDEWALIGRPTPKRSIYFGGGTPALFGPKRVAKLLDTFSPEAGIEITLEANPEDVTIELMTAYKKAGINRLSLGVQSLEDPLLKTLGRTHDSQKALEAIEICSIFDNVSIDLMYDIPGQTLEDFSSTLTKISSLPLTHVSLYNLTFEPGSLFYKKRKSYQLPPPEESLNMMNLAIEQLSLFGLKRYEISAFSRPGFEAVHNTGYWRGLEFHGLGPSAFSYTGGSRYQNVAHLKKYLAALKENKRPTAFTEKLPYPENLKELLAVQLRLVEGVDLPRFEKLRGPLPEETRQVIGRLQREGYLNTSPLALSDKGRLFYDTVASELI